MPKHNIEPARVGIGSSLRSEPPSTEFDLDEIRRAYGDITAEARWVAWKPVWDEKRQRWMKPPRRFDLPHVNASRKNPQHWTTLDDLVENLPEGYGVGVVFTRRKRDRHGRELTPLAGVDLDDCVKMKNGLALLSDEATEIVSRIGGRTELSPSGTGVKIVVRGRLAERGGHRRGNVEAYDEWYFTVTGRPLGRTPRRILRRAKALNAFVRERFVGERPGVAPVASIDGPRLDVLTVMERAQQAPSGERFALLWDGGWETAGKKSASDGDWEFALLCAEAGATSVSQIVEIARLGTIHRQKWERADYQLSTAGKALAKVAREQSTENTLTPDEVFPTLRTLLDNPEMLKPPEPLVRNLAWRGRATLIAGPDKVGKTTLVAYAAAAVTNGATFLGTGCPQGRVLWVGIEEALGDAVRRFHELGTDGDSLRLFALPSHDLAAALDERLGSWPADLVVVDSLAEWARTTLGEAPQDGDASGWGRVVRPLVALARRHDHALVILHHPRRSDHRYRGSLEIAAAVDCLWEILGPDQDGNLGPTDRRLRGRARWVVGPWTYRLTERGIETGAAPLADETRVLADTGEHPGTTLSAQRDRLGMRREVHRKLVEKLIEAGVLINRGHEQAWKLHRREGTEFSLT